jgi:hypothetical protein
MSNVFFNLKTSIELATSGRALAILDHKIVAAKIHGAITASESRDLVDQLDEKISSLSA